MKFCSCWNYAGENVHCAIHGIESAPEGVVQVRLGPEVDDE